MFHSRKISIGSIELGGNSPIVLQSMTNTDTRDIEASVEQCIRIFEAGGQMVRLSVRGLNEVESLEKIQKELRSRAYDFPLIADVHFRPDVAEAAAKIVQKVRINPGNYVERKYEGPRKFSLIVQRKQMDKIREKLKPLIDICKQNNTAIRIGVNHGSLSERMLNWYGNSPKGMVESAMEFIRIFHEENFENLVISLKASNPKLMIYANRLLAKQMIDEELHYPIHLGVTEAGDEDDGRIKSALGIGSLLADGIGDTIRVSLTEDPEKEMPVAQMITEKYGSRNNSSEYISKKDFIFSPFEYKRRISLPVERIGGKNSPVVIIGSESGNYNLHDLKSFGYFSEGDTGLERTSRAVDFLFMGSDIPDTKSISDLKLLYNYKTWFSKSRKERCDCPLINWQEYGSVIDDLSGLHFVNIDFPGPSEKFYEILNSDAYGVLILTISGDNAINNVRDFFRMLGTAGILLPVILHRKYSSASREELMIKAATELGTILGDGFGDGIWIEDDNKTITESEIREIAFSILQATGIRISKTEYISCPSCGRTLFDIQSTLQKIKKATSGFIGLKIGVMGCIVNGPGEMADADFGYVGAGKGKVTLYKGKEAIKKNIQEDEAVEELVRLIKAADSPNHSE